VNDVVCDRNMVSSEKEIRLPVVEIDYDVYYLWICTEEYIQVHMTTLRCEKKLIEPIHMDYQVHRTVPQCEKELN